MMVRTDRLRAQHEDLRNLVAKLLGIINGGKLADSAKTARDLLSELAGKLLVHLAMEDKTFYPSVIDHDARSVRLLAKRFSREMGRLRDDFKAFERRWATATFIAEEPARFAEDANGSLANLTRRIEQEDQLLYPLVEKSPDEV
jgi:hemerythrin-like domain-containing protein